MARVSLKHINKIYDNKVHAIVDLDLEVRDREFLVLVGPSGCGKTTTLRMIAGLEPVTSGEIWIDDQMVNEVSPKERDVAMVFQSYALFPYMTVQENMALGLPARERGKEQDRRIREVAKSLELEPYLKRRPRFLSGGQQQRVALGRAIVRNAKVFLMDEPLSSLDAKLRLQMRTEIVRLHKEVGATTIYVTHDQTEAMTMADRIVVMKEGRIQQIGTPKEIYYQPANLFVAGFMGSPAMNFLTGRYQYGRIFFGYKYFDLPDEYRKALRPYDGKKVIMGIRPEDIHYGGFIAQAFPEFQFSFPVEICELMGHEMILHGELEGQKLAAKISSRFDIKIGELLPLTIDVGKLYFFDLETHQNIIHK